MMSSSMIARNEAENFANNCIYGAKPACTCVCPLNLDVPKLAGYLQEGNFTLAYRHYQDQAVFPDIVSRLCGEPCRDACVRKEADSGVSLRLLERSCVAYTEKTVPRKFNLPPKNKKIAVIGSGLCGLACAQKLGAKNYNVTVYEQSDQIGGRLWNLMESGIFLPEIKLQLQNTCVTFRMNTRITSLDEIEFDAAFIATGEGGESFSLLEGTDQESFSTIRPGVFLGGNLLNTTPVEDIGQGIIAYHSIEKYLKVGLMGGIPETFLKRESPLKMDLSRVSLAAGILPRGSGGYTKEDAQSEARRCLQCNCNECRDGCELFDHLHSQPRSMVHDAVASLHTKTSIKGQRATRTMNSCNLCGLCGRVCPQEIDMGKFFHDFRYFKAEDKMLPPAFHDYFIRDMHFSNSKSYFARTAPGYLTADHVFFPGCQLGASNPEYVKKAYVYLLDCLPGTGIIHGCCGAPADWGADRALNEATVAMLRSEWEKMGRPVFIFACPTCKRQFEKFLPEVSGISLYQIYEEKGLPEEKRSMYSQACIFDPCSSSLDRGMQESVRKLAELAGTELTELFYSRDKAQCCGWGGHIQAANPSLFRKMADNRTSASHLPYITYCTNCNDTFSDSGKECVHILDIIHGIHEKGDAPPTLSQRRANRLTVKRDLLKKVWNTETGKIMDFKAEVSVAIPAELQKKMNHRLILDEDVYQTIMHSEQSGYRLFDQEKNTFTGHLQIGIITYWVEYQKTETGFLLKNVYSHRIEIVENLK